METVHSKDHIETLLTDADRGILGRILTRLGPRVEPAPLGRYATMTLDDVWLALVGQVCVIGGARGYDRVLANPELLAVFKRDVSIQAISHQQDPVPYLAQTLRNFSATRFHNTVAGRLVSILNSPSVFRDGDFIIFEKLSHQDSPIETRDQLINRCSVFRLKSASDFMIEVGLSHDVIALDTRVVGVLQKHLGFNLPAKRLQNHRQRYLSVEAALRELCQEHNASLALLDRVLFRFANEPDMQLAVEHRQLWDNPRPAG